MAYQAQGVNFDGTNDYLLRGGALTGVSDGKQWSGSFWFKRSAIGQRMEVVTTSFLSYEVYFSSSTNELNIRGENVSAGTTILDLRTSALTDTTNWHHVMWSVDLTSASARHLYVDGVSDLSVVQYTNDVIDFTQSGNHAVGSTNQGNNKYAGDLADLWWTTEYIDLSVQANREKFYGPNGGAVDLGSEGSTPTGTAAKCFFSGVTSSWHTNDGTGGGYTENGALTDAASNPPSEPDGVNVAVLAMHQARLHRVSHW